MALESASGRLLLIAEYGALNGAERSLLVVLESLLRRGWEGAALTPPGTPLARRLQEQQVRCLPLHLHAGEQRLSQEAARQNLKQVLDRERPELIHANSLSMTRLVAPVAAELGIPMLGYLRDILKLRRAAIEDLNQATRLVAVSQAVREFHIGQGLDSGRVEVIYNGVDADAFFPLAREDEGRQRVRRLLGAGPEAPVLLFVGQLGMRKGVADLLEFQTRMLQTHPRTQLWIVGERHSRKTEAMEYESALRARTESGEVAGVQWLGNREDVPELMRAADVLLHPARQEPLGRVLLEAAASGLPLLTTRVGGSAEILCTPEVSGCLISVHQFAHGVQRIRDWIDHPDLASRIGKALRAIATSKFRPEDCAARLHRIYQQLVSS